MQTYFETIKCDDFKAYHLDYHKQRIAHTVGMNFNIEEYLYPPCEKLYRCKLLYNQEKIIDIQYHLYTPRVQKKFKIIYDNDISYKYKSTNRDQLDQLFLLKENSDEIIIVKNGYVTDTSIANIALYIDNQWITPKTPLLYGTTRARYLEKNILKENDISVSMLKNASKIALLNAMIDFKVLDQFIIN